MESSVHVWAKRFYITLLWYTSTAQNVSSWGNWITRVVARILRPRQPIYGSTVQEALFLVWRAIKSPCAKRLVPYLPELIPVLERDGHLQLDEEHRH